MWHKHATICSGGATVMSLESHAPSICCACPQKSSPGDTVPCQYLSGLQATLGRASGPYCGNLVTGAMRPFKEDAGSSVINGWVSPLSGKGALVLCLCLTAPARTSKERDGGTYGEETFLPSCTCHKRHNLSKCHRICFSKA